MTQSAFETLRDKMKRQNAPGAWRQWTQSPDEMRESLAWCKRMLYELEYFPDSEFCGAIRVDFRNRIMDLEDFLRVAEKRE